MTIWGKKVAWWGGTMGVVVMVCFGLAAKDRILETWYLWRLESKNEEARGVAAERLGEMKSVRAIPKLVEALRGEPGAYQSHYSVKALAAIGPEAVLEISRALEDEKEIARIRAAESLRRIGPGAIVAVPSLINALKDENEDVRGIVAETLGMIGPRAESAVPGLSTTLATDTSVSVRTIAAGALGRIGRRAKAAVPFLAEALKCRFDDVRESAAYALGEVGSEAAGALPSLRETLEDPVDRVRLSAAEALRRIERKAPEEPRGE